MLKQTNDSEFVIKCPFCFNTLFENVGRSYLDYDLLRCKKCDNLVHVDVKKSGV